VAFKEVNFKSKLLEWSQRNKVRLDFRMLKQSKEKDTGSPMFRYSVVLEGVEGEQGEGYSKKEAQQLASEATLKRLRREPQFIDAIFAAKTKRTQMEEEPTMAVPDTAREQEFIITQDGNKAQEQPARLPAARKRKPTMAEEANEEINEFDLSDITALPQQKTREEIIADAEAAAFDNEQ
jgi:ribonuclease-3